MQSRSQKWATGITSSAKRAGHASPSITTGVYGHGMDRSHHKTAVLLENLIPVAVQLSSGEGE